MGWSHVGQGRAHCCSPGRIMWLQVGRHSQLHGRVVLASGGRPWLCAYAASCAGLLRFTKELGGSAAASTCGVSGRGFTEM